MNVQSAMRLGGTALSLGSDSETMMDARNKTLKEILQENRPKLTDQEVKWILKDVAEWLRVKLDFAHYQSDYYVDGEHFVARFGWPVIRDFIEQKCLPELER